jgi:hypothetical protein
LGQARYGINLSKSRIAIGNPVPGGSRWTSFRRARELVRQGRAMIHDAMLHFHGPAPEFYHRLEAAEFERAIEEGRGERVYWNGRSGKAAATYRPGEKVS